jgi:cellulose biosynthesis protein BcsQ
MSSTVPRNRIVTVANGKGGVGKTSCAVNISGIAAASGWQTLLIDLDTQANVGYDLGFRWAGEGDDGEHLVESIRRGTALQPVLRNVRPNLDVIPSGARLDDLEDILSGRVRRGSGVGPAHALAESLAPLAAEYDLIVIDTPPTRPTLLQLALGASTWVVVPTRTDRASIEGLVTLATQINAVRDQNPGIALLGAVVFDAAESATVQRRNAMEDVAAVLGDYAKPFAATIRHTQSTANRLREEGLLAHELAAQAAHAEPFWKALQDGRHPDRIPGSAGKLADDYVRLTHEILGRITEAETAMGVNA